MIKKEIGNVLMGDNLLKIGETQVFACLGRYLCYRNMRGNEAMGIIDGYCKFLREEVHDKRLADAVETMVLAGSVSGVFSDKNIVGFTDCGGELVEIDGVDYDCETFARNYFKGLSPSVGFGFKHNVKERGVTIYD